MATYVIRGEGILGNNKTSPKIIFGNVEIAPASEAIHAHDIKLRRIQNIFIQSGGGVSDGSFSYYEPQIKSSELNINATEGSIGNYASLTVHVIGAGSLLADRVTNGTHTLQFIALGD